MAWTQTELDVIEAAIASGTQTVSFADRTVTYRSIGELLKARDVVKAALDAASGDSQRDRTSYVIHDKR